MSPNAMDTLTMTWIGNHGKSNNAYDWVCPKLHKTKNAANTSTLRRTIVNGTSTKTPRSPEKNVTGVHSQLSRLGTPATQESANPSLVLEHLLVQLAPMFLQKPPLHQLIMMSKVEHCAACRCSLMWTQVLLLKQWEFMELSFSGAAGVTGMIERNHTMGTIMIRATWMVTTENMQVCVTMVSTSAEFNFKKPTLAWTTGPLSVSGQFADA